MKPHQHKCIDPKCGHVWTHVEPTHGWRGSAHFQQEHTCPKCDACAIEPDGGCSKYRGEPQPVAKVEPFDTVGAIIAYESGELDFDASVELFQHLVDSGLAWQLQGSYGRTASELIRQGLITENRRHG